MKKLFLMLSTVALLTACNDDYKDWADPISNPQEAAKGIAFSVAPAAAVDFNALEEVPETVALFVPTVTAEDEYSVEYDATMFNADRTESIAIEVQEIDENGNALVKASDLISAGQKLFGRNDELHVAPVAVTAYVTVDGQALKAAGETTATFTMVAPQFEEDFYMTGDPFGWGTFFPLHTTNLEGGEYKAYYYLSGGFKFSPVQGYDDADGVNVDWGQDPARAAGFLIQDGEQNCELEEDGFYQINLNMSEMKYEVLKIESISVIGSVKGEWDTDIDMTYNEANRCWSMKTTKLNAGQFKMRVNHDWTYSFGGANGDSKSYDNLTEFGGANLDIDVDGYYKIDLYLSTEGKHYVKVTKVY